MYTPGSALGLCCGVSFTPELDYTLARPKGGAGCIQKGRRTARDGAGRGREEPELANAVDRAYAEVRSRILAGTYASGLRLKEERLAADIGVSRTPVREALRRLNAEHLIRFVPNQGAFVASWSQEDVGQIFVLRSMLESYACERAASRIEPDALERLEELADRMDQASRVRDAAHHRRFLELNNQFHRGILAAARSERLERMLSWLTEVPLMLRTLDRYSDADLRRSCSHHHELVAALRARDGHWAASIMRAHLLSARTAVLGHAGEEPGA